jgi:hypothetical protein
MTIHRSSGVVPLISEKSQSRIYSPFLQIPLKESDITAAFSPRSHQRATWSFEEERFKRDHPLEVILPDGQSINIFLKKDWKSNGKDLPSFFRRKTRKKECPPL